MVLSYLTRPGFKMLPRLFLAVIGVVGVWLLVVLGLRFRKRRVSGDGMDDGDKGFLGLIALAIAAGIIVPWLIA